MIPINNRTQYPAIASEGMLPNGRRCLVVQLKYTSNLVQSDDRKSSKLEIPFSEADIFWPKEASFIPQYESDFVPFKPLCDVVLNACAYSTKDPNYLNSQVTVGVKINAWQKKFNVFGDRGWINNHGRLIPSEPRTFYKIPLHYGNAFGGVNIQGDQQQHYSSNPVGRGYFPLYNAKQITHQRLPNTQALNQVIDNPKGQYTPMAFSPLGRHWAPRVQHAGTYDDHWRQQIAPLLPADFDARFYQCAPLDQQIPYLMGGETVELFNLTPTGYFQFNLPKIDVYFTVFHKNGEIYPLQPVVDTLYINVEDNYYTLSWRAHYPITNDAFELSEIVVGKVTKGHLRARMHNKTHYSSLQALVKDQREGMALPSYKLPKPKRQANPFYFAHMNLINE